MKRALFVLVLTGMIANRAAAASIWTYTFTDQLAIDPSQALGFSFSVAQPLAIAANDTLVVTPSSLESCIVPAGGSCQFAELWWQAPGDLRVNFEYAPYSPDGAFTDDADFAIPSLSEEGVYGYRTTELATFTIHDPVVTPEPANGLLVTMGLMLFVVLRRRAGRRPT